MNHILPISILILTACDPVSGPWPTSGGTAGTGSEMPEPAGPNSVCTLISEAAFQELDTDQAFVAYDLHNPAQFSYIPWANPIEYSGLVWKVTAYGTYYWAEYSTVQMSFDEQVQTQRLVIGDAEGVVLHFDFPLSGDLYDLSEQYKGKLVAWTETDLNTTEATLWRTISTSDATGSTAHRIDTPGKALQWSVFKIPSMQQQQQTLNMAWEIRGHLHARKADIDSRGLGSQLWDPVFFDEGIKLMDNTIPVGGFCVLFRYSDAP